MHRKHIHMGAREPGLKEISSGRQIKVHSLAQVVQLRFAKEYVALFLNPSASLSVRTVGEKKAFLRRRWQSV